MNYKNKIVIYTGLGLALMGQPSISQTNSVDNVAVAAEENLEGKIRKQIPDKLLAKSLLEFLNDLEKYVPPETGEGNVKDVLSLFRHSRRVYVFTAKYNRVHGAESRRNISPIIESVYEKALGKLLWTQNRKVSSDTSNSYNGIFRNLNMIASETFPVLFQEKKPEFL